MKALKVLTGILTIVVAFALSYTQSSVFVGLSGVGQEMVQNGIDPIWLVGGLSIITLLIAAPKGAVYAGVNKEIWLPIVMEGFYLVGEWLTRSVDLSPLVEFDKINLAEAGVDPTVLINNTTYPIGIADRTDVPVALELDTYDTENTVVRNVEAMEVAYDKMASVTRGHKNSLREKFLQKAAHGWCPATNTASTPIIATTGADNGSGLKRMLLADIRTLQYKFNKAKFPQNGRVLLLCSEHLNDILTEDAGLFKTFASLTEGSLARIYSFDIYVEEATPVFNKTTGVKAAFGAAAAPSTDTHASIAWCESEVMRCDGSADMFFEKKTTGQRGDVVGFQARKLALPLRSKGIGAAYSPAA